MKRLKYYPRWIFYINIAAVVMYALSAMLIPEEIRLADVIIFEINFAGFLVNVLGGE